MRSDRIEYFATDGDKEALFRAIDSEYDFKIVERCFNKERGPKVFNGLVSFLNFIRNDADIVERRSIYYASFCPEKLRSRDVVGSDSLAEFDFTQNPDVLTFNYGERLHHKRLLLSQIGRSKGSREAMKLLSLIREMAVNIEGEVAVTVTGELVLPNALCFAKQGGRLVRTPDAPPTFDARIAC